MSTRVGLAGLNPFVLKFSDAESPVTPEDIVKYLTFNHSTEELQQTFKARIEKLAPFANKLMFIPGDQRIREKLVTPLMHAYGSYLLGNFLGVIALCGTICEMMAMFAFEASKFQINGQPMTTELQKKLFGSTFEKLGQARRTEILEAYNLIPSEVARALDKTREIRRRYLHLWSAEHSSIQEESAAIFGAAIDVVLHFFPQIVENGAVRLTPHVLEYLYQAGAVDKAEPKGGG